ncbi:hypothetical protein HHI36_003560 [Cryptolaemus montrouzieri]|uniref:Uncharacterized protein n=1 Tax=Cryptolaemus montrouzieri TaxID=559131 RepID=A0ABD2PEA3_9CUCU
MIRQKYGLKEIREIDGLVLLKLSYSPKPETIKKKLGILPISYTRLNVNNQEGINISSHISKKFTFGQALGKESITNEDKSHQPSGSRRSIISVKKEYDEEKSNQSSGSRRSIVSVQGENDEKKSNLPSESRKRKRIEEEESEEVPRKRIRRE